MVYLNLQAFTPLKLTSFNHPRKFKCLYGNVLVNDFLNLYFNKLSARSMRALIHLAFIKQKFEQFTLVY